MSATSACSSPSSAAPSSKSQWRRQLRAARAALAPDTRKRAARAVLRHALPLLLKARRIGFYWPHGAELDLLPLLRRALGMRCVCHLPVVPRKRQRVLRFAPYRAGAATRPNRYGIPEPVVPTTLPLRRLDLLFVPLVGLDDAGFRLGMGGGHYDASLARRTRDGKPLTIGVAYVCQRVSALPRDAWDKPLDGWVSEDGRGRFAVRSGGTHARPD